MEGMTEWLKKLEILKNDFPRETGQFLTMAANDVIKEIKNNPSHPVDTGTLRGTWFKVGRKDRAVFQQIIYNNTSYAAHVEWGHRIKRNGKTRGFVRGRYMLHFGIARVRMRFYRELDNLYRRLLKK